MLKPVSPPVFRFRWLHVLAGQSVMAPVPLCSSQMVELKTMAVEAVPVEMMVKLSELLTAVANLTQLKAIEAELSVLRSCR